MNPSPWGLCNSRKNCECISRFPERHHGAAETGTHPLGWAGSAVVLALDFVFEFEAGIEQRVHSEVATVALPLIIGSGVAQGLEAENDDLRRINQIG